MSKKKEYLNNCISTYPELKFKLDPLLTLHNYSYSDLKHGTTDLIETAKLHRAA